MHDKKINTLAEEFWQQDILPARSTKKQAKRNLDQVAIKVGLVVNEKGELEGTISDGVIGCGLLKGLDLNSPMASVIHRNALVAPLEMGRKLVMWLMLANKTQHSLCR